MGKQRPLVIEAEDIGESPPPVIDHQLPRCCRTRSGLPKLRYVNRAQAVDAQRRDGNLTERHHAYECPACGFWHIGHRPGQTSK